MTDKINSSPLSKIKGKVRGLSLFYSDGTERVEIWINKKYKNSLPAKNNQRIPVKLLFGSESYNAGLRMTPKCSVVWVCPNLKLNGSKVRLADIMERWGFQKNDTLEVSVSGNKFIISGLKLENIR